MVRMDASIVRRLAATVLSCSGAAVGIAAEDALPWAFVNGSAKGYSIQLVSAIPSPGSKLAVGQNVEFKITVSYALSIADKGAIVLVIQDENNKNLQPDEPQQSRSVDRGKGKVTLTQSFTVPSGGHEVRLFMPLVPQGLEHTDGELVLRYPASNEVQGSTIGYPSVAAALADLHSKPEVKFREDHGWTIAEDSGHSAFWSFAPAGDPAYPSAVQRIIVQGNKGIGLKMNVLCQSTQEACDKLERDFEALNQKVRNSMHKSE